jgi:hypothetical protein
MNYFRAIHFKLQLNMNTVTNNIRKQSAKENTLTQQS